MAASGYKIKIIFLIFQTCYNKYSVIKNLGYITETRLFNRVYQQKSEHSYLVKNRN